MSEKQLMEFWNFDDADLGANRLSKLTEKQKAYLAGEHKSQRNVSLGVGLALPLIFCCLPLLVMGPRVLLPMLQNGDTSDITEMIPLAAMSGFGLLFAGIVILVIGAVVAMYVFRANKKADLTVKQARGTVDYSWGTKRVRNPGNKARPYDDVRVLHLNIDGKKYEVHKDLQKIIKEGESWAVYYTSYPFKFLSGEQVK